MKRVLFSFIISLAFFAASAADTTKVNPRPLTMSEYDNAKSFTIKDLDNDTYVKFDNTYILDRYELRKPYFITGDDGLKKRIDLYKLVAKDGMQELGTMVFYTNENGKRYTALQPNFTADGRVWEKYFEDIHQIDKEEKNFVLKLSYVLSREMSFQLYKAINQGKNAHAVSGTYGTNICFPGDQEVTMYDGSSKLLRNVQPGDKVITIDPVTQKSTPVQVTSLVEHEAENYALTTLQLVASTEVESAGGLQVQLHSKAISATPNHPMKVANVEKKMGEVAIGDQLSCLDEKTGAYRLYTVVNKQEQAGGVQKVYNLEVSSGSTFVVNDVIVLQK